MPSKQITNPLGQSGEADNYGADYIYVLYDPTVSASTVINNGNIVEMEALTALAGQLLCKLTTSTGNFAFLGVAVDAPAGGYVPGQVIKIQTSGYAQVLFDDNSTTALGLAIQSAATAGQATYSATATVGKTLGIVLETVTVSAAGTLVPVWLRIM